MENRIAANLPGWEVVRQIGTGSSGSVYEIRRTVSGHTEVAALKAISAPKSRGELEELYKRGYDNNSISSYFRSSLEEIAREYRLMGEFKGNANIVNCSDIKYAPHENGLGWDLYIKMELLTPMLSTLGEAARDEEVIRLGMHICTALSACENRRVVHCGVKPQNIFVSRDGYYKLGDFGVSKAGGNLSGEKNLGRLSYAAPEIYMGKPHSPASDLYSLGLVMYWVLNRRRLPFLPTNRACTPAEEADARRRRVSGEALPRPAGGSQRLQNIVLRACAFDPAERYRSAAEMLSELKSLNQDVMSDDIIGGVMTSVIGSSEPYGGTTVLTGGGAPIVQPPVQQEPPRPIRRTEESGQRPARGKGWLIAVLAALVMLLFIGGVAFLVTSDFIQDAISSFFSDRDTEDRDDEGETDGDDDGGTGNTDDDDGDGGSTGETNELSWSDWSTTLPGYVFDGTYAIETCLQYRSAPLYYYIGAETLTDEFTVCYTGYGDWSSEWSSWQTTPIEATEQMEVETGTRYWYRDGWYEYYNDIQRDTPDNPWIWYWGDPQYSDNVVPAAKDGRERMKDRDQTIYRYRTRPTTYYCVKDSEWSDYGDEVLTPAHDTVVSTRIMYRYAKLSGDAKGASMQNFPASIPAYTGRFTDVPDSKWYGASQGNWAGIVVELGAMSADEFLRFRPEENVTVGELIKAAVTLRRIYNGESAVMKASTPWYSVYADYALENGIIEEGVLTDYGKAATREEAAYILSRALPAEEYAKINTVTTITDMDAKSIYYRCVLRLAESGVIAWAAPEGAFDGERSITRAEVAAMLGRIAYPDKRVHG